MDDLIKARGVLKADGWHKLKEAGSDQGRKVEAPELEKPCPDALKLIELKPHNELVVGSISLTGAINNRESRRKYTEEPLTLDELTYLLWVTQGVRVVASSGKASLRTVPSGGARHSFETYLLVRRVDGLEPGIYRYLALQHKLAYLGLPDGFDESVSASCLGQRCAQLASVVFCWTTIPYRAEWRYSIVAHKMIAIDAGHVCQNLYLGCEAVNCGTVAIGAYDQGVMDTLLGVDGVEEFSIYAATVGKI